MISSSPIHLPKNFMKSLFLMAEYYGELIKITRAVLLLLKKLVTYLGLWRVLAKSWGSDLVRTKDIPL